jgi:GTP cyclohydrolase I
MTRIRESLPDHASDLDTRKLAISQVGIRDLRYPITVWDKARKSQHTVADLALSVHLPADKKGTHMSRFIEILEGHRGEISLHTIPTILGEIQRRLESDEAFFEAQFPYFLERSAPVSGARSLMEYACGFRAALKGEDLRFELMVDVAVTTLCPCSKAVSKYGAHNQRGHVRARITLSDMVWIEDVVDAIEACASSPLYALLKREDEKWVTEKAYENPRFVEDLARDVTIALRALKGVEAVHLEVENLESIHKHSAWAVIDPCQVGSQRCTKLQRPPESEPFGTWLRKMRESRHESQRALASALDISPSVLSRIETNLRPAQADLLHRLSKHWAIDHLQIALRARALPSHCLDRIQADPEGFLAWVNTQADSDLSEISS